MPALRLGTRSSPLALWQAHHVSALLKAAVPDIEIELVKIETEGDRIRDVPLVALGGQGALGLECRVEDARTREALARIDHAPTKAAVVAERAMLRGLGGGCHVPIGARSSLQGTTLTLKGLVIDPNGNERITAEVSGP